MYDRGWCGHDRCVRKIGGRAGGELHDDEDDHDDDDQAHCAPGHHGAGDPAGWSRGRRSRARSGSVAAPTCTAATATAPRCLARASTGGFGRDRTALCLASLFGALAALWLRTVATSARLLAAGRFVLLPCHCHLVLCVLTHRDSLA